ncbi:MULTISPECIES: phage tail protein [unclassified Rhizobacter]|uniref:phage tail protein n=1 Tax=unclassified Rhizobacter TaxID=2640088 RepID=UPI0006F2050F|nr:MULTISPECIES: phage tail protein [unclassified Rhizobacter]KQU77068.1 phage tail protein [Rhizobacter sp. Root29]KQW14233.1 phage tail protein [Rhizobacter sp. Root1238]KRB18598.1 phage tail protein [Rhizobacter sp. Root16D2]
MSLAFEPATPALQPQVRRADVACFIGHVARRAGQPLPATLRDQLRLAGWIDGPWQRPAAQVESLLNLPVALDSWQQFDQLYAWDRRVLSPDSPQRCATYLGAAVRSFFARGGRRAIVLRVGDPWDYLESAAQRLAASGTRLARLLPAISAANPPFSPYAPSTWQGIQHLYGLRDTSLLLLPDLADACSHVTPALEAAPFVAPAPEGFVECSTDEPAAVDTRLQRLAPPELDLAGYTAWMGAVSQARAFLAAWQREIVFLGALPLPHLDTQGGSGSGLVHAQADMPAWLTRLGVLRTDGLPGDPQAASAFVQLAWPWLRTQASGSDLPGGLESPDGVLAGLVACGATRRGCFRSVAGDSSLPLLRDLASAVPQPAWGLGDDNPDVQLARHVCLFAQAPDGWMLQSDVTTSPSEAWRFGGASRLIGAIRRSVRADGDVLAFDLNGPTLWAQLQRQVEDLLLGFWDEGAFAGTSAAEAFEVRCDRGTMSQADLDAGRLIVEISVRPAASIERITVVLNLGNMAAASDALREAA